jgi:hypothetical protein
MSKRSKSKRIRRLLRKFNMIVSKKQKLETFNMQKTKFKG